MAVIQPIKIVNGDLQRVDTSDSTQLSGIGIGTAPQDGGVVLQEQGSDVTTTANAGTLYTKDVSTVTELFYRDGSGQVIQITEDGGLNTGALSVTGTTNLTFTINSDAAAGGDEEACLVLKSSDAAGETNSVFTHNYCLKDNGAGVTRLELTVDDDGTEITPQLNLGTFNTAATLTPRIWLNSDSSAGTIEYNTTGLQFSMNGNVHKQFSINGDGDFETHSGATYLKFNTGGAVGNNAAAFGVGSSAAGAQATAFGDSAEASPSYSTALGYQALVRAGTGSIVIGADADTNASAGDYNIAIGYGTNVPAGVSNTFIVGQNSGPGSIDQAVWGQGYNDPGEGTMVHYATHGGSQGTGQQPRGFNHVFQGGDGAPATSGNQGGEGGDSTLRGGSGGAGFSTSDNGGEGGRAVVIGGTAGSTGTSTGSVGGDVEISGGLSTGTDVNAALAYIRSGLGTGNATGGGQIFFQIPEATVSGTTQQTYQNTAFFSSTQGVLVLGGGVNSSGGASNGRLLGVTGSGAGGNGFDIEIAGGIAADSGGSGGDVVVETVVSDGAYVERLRITNQGEWQVNGSAGTSGQILSSQGTGSPPIWIDTVTSQGTPSETWLINNDAAATDTQDVALRMTAGRGAGGTTIQEWKATFDHDDSGSAGSFEGALDFEYAADNAGAFSTMLTLTATPATYYIPNNSGTLIFADSAAAAGNNSTLLGYGADTAAGTNTNATALGNNASVHTDSVAVGTSAETEGSSAVAVGSSAVATSTGVSIGHNSGPDVASSGYVDGTAIGFGAQIQGSNSTAVGADTVAAAGATALGVGASAASADSVALGHLADADFSAAVAIGHESTATAANQFVAGADNFVINDVYFGRGVTSTTGGTSATIHGTSATGDSTAGGTINLQSGSGGDSTGTAPGAGGNVTINAGDAGSDASGGSADGGDVILDSGAGSSTGAAGEIDLRINGSSTLLAKNDLAHFHIPNNDGKLVISDSSVSALGTQATAIGYGSDATGNSSTAYGWSAQATSEGSTAVGANAQAHTGHSATAIGQESTASGVGAVALGESSDATGVAAIAIGDAAQSTHDRSITLGTLATSTAANQFVVGASGAVTDTTIIGGGDTSGTADTLLVRTTDGTSEVAGWALDVRSGAGGASAGTGAGGAGGAASFFASNGGAGSGANAGGVGGATLIAAGDGGAPDTGAGAAGGDVTVRAGLGSGSEADGDVIFEISGGTETLRIADQATIHIPNNNGGFIISDSAHNALGTDATAVGYLSDAAGNDSTAFGQNARATSANAVAIGSDTTASGQNSTAVGFSAAATGTGATAIGENTTAIARATVVGDSAVSNFVGSLVLGATASATATNQGVLGSSAYPINDFYLGGGVVSSTPADTQINATGGSGTDVAGASLTLAGGQGTGTGAGGEVVFQVAPAGTTGSSLNALTDTLTLSAEPAVWHIPDNNSGAFAISDSGVTALGAAATAVGYLSDATHDSSTAFGNNARSLAPNTLSVGRSSSASSDSATAVGMSALASATDATALGSFTDATGANSIAVGHGAQAVHADTVVIGTDATSTATNELIFGSDTSNLTFGYFGRGKESATPDTTVTLRATSSTADSTAGSELTLGAGLGGDSTGTAPGAGGVLRLVGGNAGDDTSGGSANGGNVVVNSGTGSSTGNAGEIDLQIAGSSTLKARNDLAHFEIPDNSARLVLASTGVDAGANSTIIGSGADVNQDTDTDATAVGAGAVAGANATAYGSSATASANNATALGASASVTHANSIGLGHSATSTAANQLVIGNSSSGITAAYLGEGVESAAPATTVTFSATNSTADSAAGSALTLKGGVGGDSTGTAPGAGGALTLEAGAAGNDTSGGSADGGDVVITSGAGSSTGAAGTVDIQLGGTSQLLFGGSQGNDHWVIPDQSLAISDSGMTSLGTESVALGYATDVLSNGVAIGYGARAVANNSVALGWDTRCGSTGAMAVGYNATAANAGGAGNATAIGTNATSNSQDAIAIGPNATISSSSHQGAIALGNNATTTGPQQLVIGSNTGTYGAIDHVYIGRGVSGSQSANVTLQNSDNSSGNLDAGNFTIKSGSAFDNSAADNGNGGDLALEAGKGGDGVAGIRPGDGGNINLTAGAGGTFVDIGTSDGGDVNINAGTGDTTHGEINVGMTTAAKINFGRGIDFPDPATEGWYLGTVGTTLGSDALAIGFNTDAQGDGDIVIGTDSSMLSSNPGVFRFNTVIGYNCSGSDRSSTSAVGYNNSFGGIGNSVVGTNNTMSGSNAIAMGANKTVPANCIALGNGQTFGGTGGIALGNGAAVSTDGIAIGLEADASTGIAIGRGAHAEAGTCVLGRSTSVFITEYVLGHNSNGVSTNLQSVTVRPDEPDGATADLAGGNLTLQGSAGSGTGAGGHVRIQTASPAASTATAVNNYDYTWEFTDDGHMIVPQANGMVIGDGDHGSPDTDALLIGRDAGFSGGGQDEMAIGHGAYCSGNRSVAVGWAAAVTGTQGTAIGRQALAQAGAVALGDQADASGGARAITIGQLSGNKGTSADGIAIGYNSGAGNSSVSIGTGADSTAYSIALGAGSNSSVQNVMGIGGNEASNLYDIDAVYIGRGYANTSTTPLDVSIAPSLAESGQTDRAAGNLTVGGGISTGAGAGGHVLIRTAAAGSSGTVLNSYSTLAEFTDDQKIGFHGVTPVAQATDIGALTDNTGSTADNTVAQVSGSGADATINDNFADLVDQINSLRTILRDLGLMA